MRKPSATWARAWGSSATTPTGWNNSQAGSTGPCRRPGGAGALEPVLAARNGNELERLKQETGWKEGNPLPRVSYQGLATVLAVTTSVVNPLIELAIIFLPQILSFFNEGRQRDQLRQKVTNEIIPSVKRELRDRLPALLAEQMDVLVTQVGAEFGHEIGEKQKLIDELVTTRNQDAEAAGHQIALLSSAREQLQQLAKQALYEPGQ